MHSSIFDVALLCSVSGDRDQGTLLGSDQRAQVTNTLMLYQYIPFLGIMQAFGMAGMEGLSEGWP